MEGLRRGREGRWDCEAAVAGFGGGFWEPFAGFGHFRLQSEASGLTGYSKE